MAIGIGTAVAAAAPEILGAVEGAGAVAGAAEGAGAAAEGAGGLSDLTGAAKNLSGGQFGGGGGSNPLKSISGLAQSNVKLNLTTPTDTSKSPGSDPSTEIL